ncbi:hypothetical protein [Paraherbaspirillum soli]|uniref:Flagellar hook-length control protein FliK n=1 Tax=Paraherbaspirillum soli TaxID=631222 RepID=A0ABW0MC76_9BURK
MQIVDAALGGLLPQPGRPASAGKPSLFQKTLSGLEKELFSSCKDLALQNDRGSNSQAGAQDNSGDAVAGSAVRALLSKQAAASGASLASAEPFGINSLPNSAMATVADGVKFQLGATLKPEQGGTPEIMGPSPLRQASGAERKMVDDAEQGEHEVPELARREFSPSQDGSGKADCRVHVMDGQSGLTVSIRMAGFHTPADKDALMALVADELANVGSTGASTIINGDYKVIAANEVKGEGHGSRRN